jgi:SAM-dependent methyltransferase
MTDSVEALYHDYPYPGHGVVSAVIARMIAPAVEDVRRRTSGRRVRLLDAGCGTGEQALGMARAFPDVEVVGVDLSVASLEMARSLAARETRRRHKRGERDQSGGVRFERRDLTQPLADLGTFDVIVSVGVLHHLPEPARGFERLREIIAPGGAFLGMVYGKFGKWPTFQLRDALRLLGGSAPRDAMLRLLVDAKLADNTGPFHYLETLARRVRFGPSIPWNEAVRRTLAGRNNAYQADTFTHVQEAAFTWAELADLLLRTGWQFEGWPKKSGMPDHPRQVFRGAALEALDRLPPLERAAVYERVIRPVCLYFLASPRSGEDVV